MKRTHYQNLKVAEDAPVEVIRAAYRALSQQYHPDRNPSADALRIMQIINDSYEVLSDPVARARHDESIRRARQQGPGGTPPRQAQTPPGSGFNANSSASAASRTASTSSGPRSWSDAQWESGPRRPGPRPPGARPGPAAARSGEQETSSAGIYLLVGIVAIVGIYNFLMPKPAELPPVAPYAKSAMGLSSKQMEDRLRDILERNTPPLQLDIPPTPTPTPSTPSPTPTPTSLTERQMEERLRGIIGERPPYSPGIAEVRQQREALMGASPLERFSLGELPLTMPAHTTSASGSGSGSGSGSTSGSTPSAAEPSRRQPARRGERYERPVLTAYGKAWPRTSSYLSGAPREAEDGFSTLTVDNTACTTDVHVKLYAHPRSSSSSARSRQSAREPRVVRECLIKAGSVFKFADMTPGTYEIRYRDLDSGHLSKSEPMTVSETEDKKSNSVHYDAMTLTLYKVENGNSDVLPLDEEDF